MYSLLWLETESAFSRLPDRSLLLSVHFRSFGWVKTSEKPPLQAFQIHLLAAGADECASLQQVR